MEINRDNRCVDCLHMRHSGVQHINAAAKTFNEMTKHTHTQINHTFVHIMIDNELHAAVCCVSLSTSVMYDEF